jgi:hypothetical protein
MMSIEELVDNMTAYLADKPAEMIPQPCSEEEIRMVSAAFLGEFGHPLPAAYQRILRHANGVVHNGLTIWPAVAAQLFRETIIEANRELRDMFSDAYLYFGQRDEELYVFELSSKRWCAIEFVGAPEWAQFASAEEMFEFMLERAWE